MSTRRSTSTLSGYGLRAKKGDTGASSSRVTVGQGQTAREQRQVVPCRAGVLSVVVYHNGDVSLCEAHKPLGNLRTKSFKDIWHSDEAKQLRKSISDKECYCTNEIFMWPSITFQPVQLVRAMAGARVWRKTVPLPERERTDWRSGEEAQGPDDSAPLGTKMPLPILPS